MLEISHGGDFSRAAKKAQVEFMIMGRIQLLVGFARINSATCDCQQPNSFARKFLYLGFCIYGYLPFYARSGKIKRQYSQAVILNVLCTLAVDDFRDIA